eukprot:TRINITY_DN14459_c0_g2_i5.p1 TRINITY_DN14459_c0_g2~~TRINITY_DN14459_c0_g2_i5.p1  ORF type:complete len:246 (+),score=39.65 TRINITY_DN14459_c0_g2_i5:35-739(+)
MTLSNARSSFRHMRAGVIVALFVASSFFLRDDKAFIATKTEAQSLSSALQLDGRNPLALGRRERLSEATTEKMSFSQMRARGGENEEAAAASTTWMDCDLSFSKARFEEVRNEPPETWIFQQNHFDSFSKFLTTRKLSPLDVEISCEPQEGANSKWDARACEECVKLNMGGPYGSAGVVSPAYPPQDAAGGCLNLSGNMNVDLSSYDGLGDDALSDDSYDGTSSPRAVAFCRTK